MLRGFRSITEKDDLTEPEEKSTVLCVGVFEKQDLLVQMFLKIISMKYFV